MFTFCDVLHDAKQKTFKQTLESTQYRLEISFNIINSYPFSSCEVQFWKAVNPKGNLKNEVELERESNRKKAMHQKYVVEKPSFKLVKHSTSVIPVLYAP